MENAKWTRPRTSRIYLHPPLAERLIVLYPDFKATDSSLLDNGTHLSQPGIGFTLLHGEEMEAFDYEEYKKNGFKVKKLGDYPLSLETKPD